MPAGAARPSPCRPRAPTAVPWPIRPAGTTGCTHGATSPPPGPRRRCPPTPAGRHETPRRRQPVRCRQPAAYAGLVPVARQCGSPTRRQARSCCGSHRLGQHDAARRVRLDPPASQAPLRPHTRRRRTPHRRGGLPDPTALHATFRHAYDPHRLPASHPRPARTRKRARGLARRGAARRAGAAVCPPAPRHSWMRVGR